MGTKTMTLGVNLSAYADVALPDGMATTKESLIAFAKKVEGDVVFLEDWGTQEGLRVVQINIDGKSEIIGASVYRDPRDSGQAFDTFIRGQTSLVEAVTEVIGGSETVEVHQGFVSIRGNRVQVDFQVRNGATNEEKEIAFLAALLESDGVEADYFSLGETAKAKVIEPNVGTLEHLTDEQLEGERQRYQNLIDGPTNDDRTTADGSFYIDHWMDMIELIKAEVQRRAQKCGDCGSQTVQVIGCPDGAEVCRQCFDSGAH